MESHLGEGVEGVEHLDGDQHRQRQRGGLGLAHGEVVARVDEAHCLTAVTHCVVVCLQKAVTHAETCAES